MSEQIDPPQNCCPPVCTDPVVVNIPGPPGTDGTDGTPGAAGINAFSITTASFEVPLVLDNVTVSCDKDDWGVPEQIVFIETAGYYKVDSKTLSPIFPAQFELQNLGYPGNAVPTTVIATGRYISPSGLRGPTGASGSGVTLNDISPTTTKGDILADNGANNPNASLVRLAAGTNGMRAKADSTQPTGLLYAKVDLANGAEVTGLVALTNGGTGAATAVAARTALGLVIGTDVQAENANLLSIAGLVTAADRIAYFTAMNTAALTVFTALARTLLAGSTTVSMRSTLGGVLPKYGLLGSVTAMNLNSANTDNAVTLESTRYRVDKVVFQNASTSLATATAGVFVSPGGAGTVIATDQVLSALTAAIKYHDLTLDGGLATNLGTAGTIYVRCGTANGGAATADVSIFGWSFS